MLVIASDDIKSHAPICSPIIVRAKSDPLPTPSGCTNTTNSLVPTNKVHLGHLGKQPAPFHVWAQQSPTRPACPSAPVSPARAATARTARVGRRLEGRKTRAPKIFICRRQAQHSVLSHPVRCHFSSGVSRPSNNNLPYSSQRYFYLLHGLLRRPYIRLVVTERLVSDHLHFHMRSSS